MGKTFSRSSATSTSSRASIASGFRRAMARVASMREATVKRLGSSSSSLFARRKGASGAVKVAPTLDVEAMIDAGARSKQPCSTLTGIGTAKSPRSSGGGSPGHQQASPSFRALAGRQSAPSLPLLETQQHPPAPLPRLQVSASMPKIEGTQRSSSDREAELLS